MIMLRLGVENAKCIVFSISLNWQEEKQKVGKYNSNIWTKQSEWYLKQPQNWLVQDPNYFIYNAA